MADDVPSDRVRIAQAPGGTGSLWVLMQLVNRARPGATIHVSDPTWPNHMPIAQNAGLKVEKYPYFDAETRGVKFEQMLAVLDKLGKDDVVLLHGCCHNPTGANLTNAQWDQVAASLARTGALPFMRSCLSRFWRWSGGRRLWHPQGGCCCARSIDRLLRLKNFGLYRERIGAAILIARDEKQADIAQSQLLNIIRSSYSQPPDHGAEIIRTILEDPALRAEWETEPEAMRNRMITLRETLSDAIRNRSNSKDFDFIATHRGMFSLLGLPKATVDHLKTANGIYMIGDSRINVAGIPEDRAGDLADALIAAMA
ncbi:aminotransferase class I/II-fold pyridoxal phosphate-dependent enzyme [Devosia algicola]|uniref:Aminotransferase class I/II-fold pyridoxal phosphate-dependent enzyme n=1 Tax=Devosia algicola TaxID=3026418 RepID=A0ABY7YMM1_9HYPH|nr:aminotransferase class I/II-fold pyridoxal phosphate-dependent enzyme [Devosia algicola]WDR02427.1 aminotransferase class I/II-fold pyridoxal phosphate-dependent enzyme [Devosia algicola]